MIRILYDDAQDRAVMWCDELELAFGPVAHRSKGKGPLKNLRPDHVLRRFIDWLPLDPRTYCSDHMIAEWRRFVESHGGADPRPDY